MHLCVRCLLVCQAIHQLYYARPNGGIPELLPEAACGPWVQCVNGKECPGCLEVEINHVPQVAVHVLVQRRRIRIHDCERHSLRCSVHSLLDGVAGTVTVGNSPPCESYFVTGLSISKDTIFFFPPLQYIMNHFLLHFLFCTSNSSI